MDYAKLKVKELKKICKENGIRGYSKMRKNEIIVVLRQQKQDKGPSKMRPMSPLLNKIQKLI